MLTVYSEFAMHLINHLMSCVPKEPAHLGLQNHLAFACCMKPGSSSSLCPHTDLSEIYIPSPLLSTYYHTDTMLTSSLFR